MATVKKFQEEELNSKSFEFGDLVLAKVKDFPFWPAKVSRPEEHEHTSDPRQYFVKFFGTGEIAFVGPADIQAFTNEKKIELSQGKSKPFRDFGKAVNEICEEFEKLQHKDFSSIRNDGALVDEALEVCSSGGANKGPKCNSEIIGMSSLLAGSQKQEGMARQDIIKPNLTVMDNTSILTEEEGLCEIKVDGTHPTGGQDKFTYGHHSTVDTGIKKKFNGAGGIMQIKGQVGYKFNSVERNGKMLLKDIKHSEENYEDRNDNLSLEKVKVKRDLEIAEASRPSKKPKHADSQDTGMVKAQMNMKRNYKDSEVLDDKIESKMLALGGKAENQHQSRAQMNEANHSDEEDDLPLLERYRHLLSGKKLGKSVFRRGNKIRSQVTQLPTKRRAVLFCDDDEDELPKSPIHGGFTTKVSAIPHVSDSNNERVKHGGNNCITKLLSSNLGAIGNFKEEAKPAQALNAVSRPLVSVSKVENSLLRNTGLVPANKIAVKQPQTKRRTVILCNDDGRDELPKTPIHGGSTSKASDIPYVSGSKSKPVNHVGNNGIGKLVSRKPASSLVKPVLVSSPPSPIGTRELAESQNKQLLKVHGNISQKKAPVGTNRGLSLTERSSLNRLTSETWKPASSGAKGKSPRSDSWINDSVLVVRNSNESVSSVDERFQTGKDERKNLLDSKTPDSAMLMKNLIAAAQERKRQAHNENSFSTFIHDADVAVRSPSPVIVIELTSMPQLDVQGLHVSPINGHVSEELEKRRVSSGRHTTVSLLTVGTEAAVSRDALERMLETLSRTKESIRRATRLAIDCAKHGIATEVVELLVKKLENEPSLRRRVDFFFLVDSITQCSYSQRGVAGASFLPIIQSALPRLLGAAAPPGTTTQENRRQCHKVLRLWLERNILPESVLRRYMDEIRVENDDDSAGFLLRRPSRYERGVDDPIRYMEMMFVDEYGSNVTFPVPGLLPCHAFDDEEDEDDFLTNFDKVKDLLPPTHTPVACTDPGKDHVTPIDRGHFIVGDVAGEPVLEDISGQQKDYQVISTGTIQSEQSPDQTKGQYQIGSDMNNEPISPTSPPFPDGSPPPMPPLPTSPCPPLSPSSPAASSSPTPPPPPPRILQQHLFPPQPYPTPPTSYLTPPYAAHVPPLVSQQHQSAFTSQHRLSPPSLVQPYAQRPLRPIFPPQLLSNQFSFINSVQQYQYPIPYSNPRRNATDEHMQVNMLSADSVHGAWSKVGRSNTAPHLDEGHFGPPTERRPPSVLSFQPSGPNVLPVVTPVTAHCMMPPRPDTSTVNWRPA